MASIEKWRTLFSSDNNWPTTTPRPVALSALAHPWAAEGLTKGRFLSLQAAPKFPSG